MRNSRWPRSSCEIRLIWFAYMQIAALFWYEQI